MRDLHFSASYKLMFNVILHHGFPSLQPLFTFKTPPHKQSDVRFYRALNVDDSSGNILQTVADIDLWTARCKDVKILIFDGKVLDLN